MMQLKNLAGKSPRALWLFLVYISALYTNLYFASDAHAMESAAYVGAPRPKRTGVYAKNYKLRSARLLAKGKIKGPEDIAIDSNGAIYAGSSNGNIYRITNTADDTRINNTGANNTRTDNPAREKIELFANPGGGQALGLMFTKDGTLISCNCPKGLLAIDKSGQVRCLTNSIGDTSITYPDDLDIASDGKIYFSFATIKRRDLNGYRNMFVDLLECRPNGQLLVYDPVSKTTVSLLKDLFFANGIALSPNEEFVLVNETYRYRITRYWLKGPKAGTSDLFADNLPGMPDGITRDPSGGYWVTMVVPRTAYMDFVQARPRLKRFFSHLPIVLWGKMPHYGMVLKLNNSGSVTESLQDPSGRVATVTNAVPWKDYLFLGTLQGSAVARVKLERDLQN